MKQGDVLKPAHYKHGQTFIVKSFDIDINGGLFEINNTGTSIDGTIIEIPKGELDQKNNSLGWL